MNKIACIIIALIYSSFGLAQEKPNILWLSAEDISPQIGCFKDPYAITPNLDELAEEGVRYLNAFTTAGVCAPSRSSIVMSMYQTTLGTQHMRGNVLLPEAIKPFPYYLRKAGYYCTNTAKEDYQFITPEGVWDASSNKAHWRNRKDKNQPFFAVFNYGGCHASGIKNDEKYLKVTSVLTPEQRQDPQAFDNIPPYYPDTQTTRENWKRNYELITALDIWIGNKIKQLKDDGLYDNTIIMFWSDHGIGLPRAKRWLYDSGTRIPLIVHIPEKFRVNHQAAPNTISEQLVSAVDFGATVLSLAGVEIPSHMQGKAFLGDNTDKPREYVFGARDRMDERYDIIRMTRDKRYKYIRNYEPLKAYYQYMNSSESGKTMKELRTLHEAGKLHPEAEIFFSETKPIEELYDTWGDPHEVNNIADNPKYEEVLSRLRETHLDWVKLTRDSGLIPEPILVENEKKTGSRYAILKEISDAGYPNRLADIAVKASEGISALPYFENALKDKDPSIRYWAATGIGNIGKPAIALKKKVQKLLKDKSSVVRTAAARALCRMDKPSKALPVLTSELKNGEQWERLYAANVLDEIDEMALPVIKEMHDALVPKEELYQKGKYVVRVINRALNQLEGTDKKVR